MKIIETIFEIAVTLLALMAVLRFLMIYFGSPWRHPIGQWCYTLTEFPVSQIKKILPKSYKMDVSSLIWAYILDLVLVLLNMIGYGQMHMSQLASILPFTVCMAIVVILKQTVYLLMTSVFVYAILSWISPNNLLMGLAKSLTFPFLEPVRKILPPFGQLDLSPVILMIVYQLTITVLIGALEMLIERLI